MTWRATLDDFSTTSGNNDIELTQIVARVRALMQTRGVRVFKLEHITKCDACGGTGRCSDPKCFCMSDRCAECSGTGQV